MIVEKERIEKWVTPHLEEKGWGKEKIENAIDRLGVMPNNRLFDLYAYHILKMSITDIADMRYKSRKTVWCNITSYYGIPASRWNILTPEEKAKIKL